MKHLRKVVFIIIFFVIPLLSGCGKINQIKVTSCGVESITPIGFRGVKAELSMTIDNPAMQFVLTDIKGVLYYKGKKFVDYVAEPVLVRRHTEDVYPLKGEVYLADTVNFSDILVLIESYNPEDFSIDIHAKMRLKSGISKNLVFKDIPIRELMRRN